MKERAMKVLLVEDNEGDVQLLQIAFERESLSSDLSIVHDGAEALDFLYRRGAFPEAARPDIILLDLNMPKMSGNELLNIIKYDANLKSIPVIVFSSSGAPADIAKSYQNYANSYIIKPFRIGEYIEVAKQVEKFWVNLSQLPDNAVMH